MVQEVYILSGARTPIGKFMGYYQKTPAVTLGATVIREAVKRSKVAPSDVDEIIIGQVLTAGQGQNAARLAALEAEMPVSAPAYTINMLCGSGLKAALLAYQSIVTEHSSVVVCGGQENMTMAEHTAYLRCSSGIRIGDVKTKDSILRDGLVDTRLNLHMGGTAEHLAKEHKVSREAQDAFAVQSQNKAEKAIKEGYFKEEIVAVQVQKNFVEVDEYPRFGTSIETLKALTPAFQTDGSGSVTPGNASGVNDGAAALVLCSGKVLQEKNLTAQAKIIAFAEAAIEGINMGIAPIPTIEKLFKQTGWTKDDVDLFELNEAFAVQTIIIIEKLGLDVQKVNVSGGAIALGHPIGASGARVLVTLIHNLKRLGKKRGVAALCVGGGIGIAVAIEAC